MTDIQPPREVKFYDIPVETNPAMPKDAFVLRQGRLEFNEDITRERDKLREENAALLQALSKYLDAADAHHDALGELRCAIWGHSWGDYYCLACDASWQGARNDIPIHRPSNIQGST